MPLSGRLKGKSAVSSLLPGKYLSPMGTAYRGCPCISMARKGESLTQRRKIEAHGLNTCASQDSRSSGRDFRPFNRCPYGTGAPAECGFTFRSMPFWWAGELIPFNHPSPEQTDRMTQQFSSNIPPLMLAVKGTSAIFFGGGQGKEETPGYSNWPRGILAVGTGICRPFRAYHSSTGAFSQGVALSFIKFAITGRAESNFSPEGA